MPRKKKQLESNQPKAVPIEELYAVAREENNYLRQRLDEQADRYNLANQAQTVAPTPYLSKESKRQIYSTTDLQQFVGEIFTQGLSTIGFKNRDYGDHKNCDPFGNFRRHGTKGFLVRIDDKLSRLNTYCDSGRLAVTDESVLDTIVDAANYLGILAAFLYSESLPKEEGQNRVNSTFGMNAGFGAKPR